MKWKQVVVRCWPSLLCVSTKSVGQIWKRGGPSVPKQGSSKKIRLVSSLILVDKTLFIKLIYPFGFEYSDRQNSFEFEFLNFCSWDTPSCLGIHSRHSDYFSNCFYYYFADIIDREIMPMSLSTCRVETHHNPACLNLLAS